MPTRLSLSMYSETRGLVNSTVRQLFKSGEVKMRAFFIILLFFCSPYTNAEVISFDDYEFTGTSSTTYFDPLDIGEYRFTPTDTPTYQSALGFFQQGSPYYKGSAGIIGVNGSNIVLSRIDGQAFSISSIDIDHIFALGTPLEVVGTLTGGGSITQTFLADYTIGYQSMALIDFGNITSLQLGAVGENNANLAAWDNITLGAPVPLPAAVWLFGSGLIGLIGIARRKKS
ncbi:MAG: VPLPA-CTERM sorting domain-containing protein [Gammaproteobacteria bacterium]|nr:VPLPA-CTERM sorting domain-containing protein [Gammaproteobacteria bacterium]